MEQEIESWADGNKDRAKALGLRLMKYANDVKGLLDQPSLGDFEDKASRWAAENPFKARMLLFKLLPKFK